MTPEEVEKLIGDLEVAVDRLRSLYEQYFMGFEKLEPLVPRKDVDRRIHALRKEQVRNTAQRFRFQMLLQRYNTYQTHWQRILREIENGTYKRHLVRAEKRFGTEAATKARAIVGPQPGAPITDPTIANALAELDLDFAPPPAKPVAPPAAPSKKPVAAPLQAPPPLPSMSGAPKAPPPLPLPKKDPPNPIVQVAPQPPRPSLLSQSLAQRPVPQQVPPRPALSPTAATTSPQKDEAQPPPVPQPGPQRAPQPPAAAPGGGQPPQAKLAAQQPPRPPPAPPPRPAPAGPPRPAGQPPPLPPLKK